MTQILRLQILRATTAERTAYTPLVGEFILDTDANVLYIGDGSTAGGVIVTSLGGGEANTASNVGGSGFGLFKQKTGVDLEFFNIASGSSKVTVLQDVPNDEIEIDILPENINTSELNNDADFRTGAQVTSSVNSGISTHEAAADPHPNYALESSLATVATSGDYNDLINKPSIPSVIDDLNDVDTTTVSPQVGWVLKWDGSNWVPALRATLENTTQQGNNTTTPSIFLQGNITLPRAGNYLVRTTYRWSLDDAASDFVGRFDIGGVQQIPADHFEEPKDSAGTGPFGTDQRMSFTAAWIYTGVAGSVNFQQFFSCATAGDNAAIYNCLIEVEELF